MKLQVAGRRGGVPAAPTSFRYAGESIGSLVDGELWRYDRWVAWIHDSQIRELWAAN